MKRANRKKQDEAERGQQELMKEAAPPATSRIKDGQIAVEFVGVKLRIRTDRKRMLRLSFSLLLDEAVGDFLDDKIGRSFRDVAGHECDSVEPTLARQTIKLRDFPEQENVSFFAVVKLHSAVLKIVEEKGAGKTKKGVRFSFSFDVPQDRVALKWAAETYGGPVWMTMERTQPDLIPADDDDDGEGEGERDGQ